MAEAITQETVDRINRLARPVNFLVSIEPENILHQELSHTDLARLYVKLELVAQIAAKLSANMCKGVIKYPQPVGASSRDSLSVRDWLENGIDDAVDSVNYLHLLKQEMEVQGLV